MPSLKYFTNGYPANTQSNVYGLYQPVLNCFLFILPDYPDIGAQLTAILSSRYTLQPICVSSASNYAHNIIDNEVCHNWTISNLHQVSARSLMSDCHIINAEQLLPTTVTIEWDVEKEKQWVQFCAFWLRFIRLIKNTGYSGGWIDELIGSNKLFGMFDSMAGSAITDFVEQVTGLLYLGQDLLTTEQSILELVNGNESYRHFLHHAWSEAT
jgi:hypothetical protein